MASLVKKEAKDYIDNLQQLRRCLGEHANVTAAVLVHRVCGQVQAIGKVIPSFFSGSPPIIVIQRIFNSWARSSLRTRQKATLKIPRPNVWMERALKLSN
jgi:hypothetical protein